MGTYIKGMAMPKCCDDCWALDDDGDYPRCRITQEQRGYTFRVREKRMDRCPLVPVPVHGRLIDGDALWEGLVSNRFMGPIDLNSLCVGLASNSMVALHVKACPTIIPAEEATE